MNEGVLEEDDGPEDDPSRQDPLVPFCGGRAAYPNFDDRPVGHWPNGRRFFQVVPIEVEGNPKDRLCVVSRCVYIHCAFDCFRSPMEDGNAYTFVRGFGSRAAAEDFRRKKIDQARRVVAPGRIETFPDPEELEKLAEGIRKLGLTTPDPDELSDESSRFGLWWPAVAGVATPEQRLAAWELLEGVSLFEVFEVKLVD